MPSIKVVYGEAETTVSVDSPNTLLQELVEKAKAAFSIPAEKTNFELRFQKKPVEPLLPFRLSGILSNSTVELVSVAKANNASKTTTVALEFGAGRKRVEGKFAPSSTLADVFNELAPNEDVTAARLMNRRFEKDQFGLTLTSLGLVSGAVLFRLESSSNVTNSAPNTATALSPSASQDVVMKDESAASNAVQNTPVKAPTLFDEIQSVEERKVAVITLMKILRNVYLNPMDEKMKSIRATNPAIKSKLKDSTAAFELLKKAGFQQVRRDSDDFMVITNVSKDAIEPAYAELERLAQIVGVPVEDRPSLSSSNPTPSTSTPTPPPFEFDPFKTNVIGLANTGGPKVRVEDSGMRTLEEQVADLKAKKLTMMQAESKVQNRQVVAMVHSADFNPRRFVRDDEEEDGADAVSRSTSEDYDLAARVAISQHYKHVQDKQKKAENFQTKAMREYDQLSRSKVYTRTLIRVVFPDRSIVQAIFSPLETVGDVCNVLMEACPALQSTEFFLLTGPPPTRLDPSQNLESLGFIPAASLQLSCPSASQLTIHPELFSQDKALINVKVPKGEPLVKTAAARSSVPLAAGGKPKWLKL